MATTIVIIASIWEALFFMADWLPTTKKEAAERGWDELDVILISGDAYVDHPSFGHAVVARMIESRGLKVAVVPQPNWQDDLRDFKKLGKPRLFFGISSGCMDPMVNHYTASRRRRSTDAYTPGGKAGFRPDYAGVVYGNILKSLFPDVPVIIGGIEGSLRRVTHYDYWSDRLKPSILVQTPADLLVYGMGEQPLITIVDLLKRGVPFSSLTTIPQTAYIQDRSKKLPKNKNWKTIELPSHTAQLKNKKIFAEAFKTIEIESNRKQASRLTQAIGEDLLVINPPFAPMNDRQMDAAFDLPFTRLPHPKYKKRGPIPAFEMIRFSITMHRGCFGGCSFCTISAHQGKQVVSRSKKSILKEVDAITKMPGFKGYVSDLGGPSANMYKMGGKDSEPCDTCLRPSCIFPAICNNLDTSHKPLMDIYDAVCAHPGVKRAFVSSGIRHDLLLHKEKNHSSPKDLEAYMKRLVTRHVSGRLKIAPEHTSDRVLKLMRKPSFNQFAAFKKKFEAYCRAAGLKQQMIPYFISSHPGSELEDMANLAVKTKNLGFRLEQVQDFTPTPMTLATAIYYSGYHPYTLKKIYTAKTQAEKENQRRFFFWYKKENRSWIRKALAHLDRESLAESLLGQGIKKPKKNSRGR